MLSILCSYHHEISIYFTSPDVSWSVPVNLTPCVSVGILLIPVSPCNPVITVLLLVVSSRGFSYVKLTVAIFLCIFVIVFFVSRVSFYFGLFIKMVKLR